MTLYQKNTPGTVRNWSSTAWGVLLAARLSLVPTAAGTHIVSSGDNTYGELNVPPDLTNAVAVASGIWILPGP